MQNLDLYPAAWAVRGFLLRGEAKGQRWVEEVLAERLARRPEPRWGGGVGCRCGHRRRRAVGVVAAAVGWGNGAHVVSARRAALSNIHVGVRV